ncbi:MAG: hypothetical protein ABIH21_02265 [Patescibacteria group bacterium]
MNVLKNQSGSAIIIAVLLLSAAIFSIFVAISRSSILSLSTIKTQENALIARSIVSGCLNEVLIQLTADNNFSDSPVAIGTESCNVVYSEPEEGQKEFVITHAYNDAQYGVDVIVTLDPFAVESVVEEI